MRTTLTLDDDVAKLLERACKERGTSLKQVVNDALRRGLSDGPVKRTPYRTKAVPCGPPLMNLDNIGEVVAILDGEDHR